MVSLFVFSVISYGQKYTIVSSLTSTGATPVAIYDGNTSAGWQDPTNVDNTWVTVDLGSVKNVNSVKIYWEAANAKAYNLQTSSDNISYTTQVSKTNMAAGNRTDLISGLNVDCRYVRMQGVTRQLPYGYNIWEFEVYPAVTPVLTSLTVTPATPSITLGNTQQFTVAGLDQLGNAIALTNTTTWSVTGTGTAINSSGLFSSTSKGVFTVTALNTSISKTATIEVLPSNTNLSYVAGVSATATASTPATGNVASYAFDNNGGSRWESAASDPQWIKVDLGGNKTITDFLITWEGASGKNYIIETSTDNSNWTTVVTKTNMANGARTDRMYDVNCSGRYVRLTGSVRTTGYGYSIYEFKIFGSNLTTPNLTFATPTSLTKNYGDALFTNLASSSNSVGAITYSSGNTGVATINSTTGEVTIHSAGSAVITATIAANGSYSSTTASYTLTVNGVAPNLTFATPTTITKDYGEAPFTNTASSSNSLGTISYSSGNTSVATVNATTGEVTIIAAGTAVITATIAANLGYTSGTATYTLTVNGIAPTLSFATSSLTKKSSDAAFTNAASSSNSTGDITYSSDNTNVATVNSTTGQVTIVAVGTANITATITAKGSYTSTTASYSLTVIIPIGSIRATSVPMYLQGSVGGDIAQPINTSYALMDYKVVTKSGKSWVYTKFTGTSAIDLGASWTSQFRYWSASNVKNEINLTGIRNATTKVVLGTTSLAAPNPLRISFFQALVPGGYGESLVANYTPTASNTPVVGDVTAPTISACDVNNIAETTAELVFTGSDGGNDLFYEITDPTNGIEEFALTSSFSLTGLTPLTTYNLTIKPIDYSGNEGTPITKQFTTAGLVQIHSGVAKDIRFALKSTATELEYYYEYTDSGKKFRDATFRITPDGGAAFDLKPTISPDSTYCYGKTSDARIANAVLALNFEYLTFKTPLNYAEWEISNTTITSGDLTGTIIKHKMGMAVAVSDAVKPTLSSVTLMDVSATNAKLNLQGSDNSGSMYYAITGGTSAENGFRTGNYYFLNLATGQNVYTLNIQAKDLSGNTSTNTITQKVKSMKTRSNINDNVTTNYNTTVLPTEPGGELVTIIQYTGNTMIIGCTTASAKIPAGASRNRIFNTPTVIINGTSYTLTVDANGTTATRTFTDAIGAIQLTTGASFSIRWSVFWANGGGNFFTGTFAYSIGDSGQADSEGPAAAALSLSGNTLSWPACTDQLSGVKWYIVTETGQSSVKIFDFGESNFSYTMSNPANEVSVTAVDFVGNSTMSKYNGADINVTHDTSATSLTTCTTCNLTVSNGVNLDVNTSTTLKNVTVNPGGKLTVSNSLVVNDFILKSDLTSTFSAKITTPITINGTAKYLKTINDTKWYFISFPCDVKVSEITVTTGSLGVLGTNWFLKYYSGSKRATLGTATSNWLAITKDTIDANPNYKLNKYQGYIVGLETGKGTLEMSFPLDKTIVSSETTRTIPVSENSGPTPISNHGWNLIGQPYLSNYVGNNASGDFYIYNYDASLGVYIPYSKSAAPDIQPFSAYFIQANTSLANSGISFDLAGRQSVRSLVAINDLQHLRIDLKTTTGTDNTELILGDNQSTSYQIGQDFEKWIGTGTSKPQIYTTLNGINFAFNALPSSEVNKLPLGIYTKNPGNSTIHLDASTVNEGTQILLRDNTTGAVSDLVKSDYNFVADANTTTSRFDITIKRVATANPLANQQEGCTLFYKVGKLQLINLNGTSNINIYDALGRRIFHESITTNNAEIPLKSAGCYTVQYQREGKTYIQKIITN